MRLDILYVMAVTQEYGPHLQARINPVMTGVGPVEAAVTVGVHLAELMAGDRLPHLVVSLQIIDEGGGIPPAELSGLSSRSSRGPPTL